MTSQHKMPSYSVLDASFHHGRYLDIADKKQTVQRIQPRSAFGIFFFFLLYFLCGHENKNFDMSKKSCISYRSHIIIDLCLVLVPSPLVNLLINTDMIWYIPFQKGLYWRNCVGQLWRILIWIDKRWNCSAGKFSLLVFVVHADSCTVYKIRGTEYIYKSYSHSHTYTFYVGPQGLANHE